MLGCGFGGLCCVVLCCVMLCYLRGWGSMSMCFEMDIVRFYEM